MSQISFFSKKKSHKFPSKMKLFVLYVHLGCSYICVLVVFIYFFKTTRINTCRRRRQKSFRISSFFFGFGQTLQVQIISINKNIGKNIEVSQRNSLWLRGMHVSNSYKILEKMNKNSFLVSQRNNLYILL